MIDEEVATCIMVSKIGAVFVPTILAKVEIAIPMVLANKIPYTLTSLVVGVPRYKMCFRLN
jgi:hypothetical protein